MALNSANIEDLFVTASQTQGTPTLDGASEGSDTFFGNLLDTAKTGLGIYNKYTNANQATAEASAPPVVTAAQGQNKYALYALIGGAALLLFVLIRRK